MAAKKKAAPSAPKKPAIRRTPRKAKAQSTGLDPQACVAPREPRADEAALHERIRAE